MQKNGMLLHARKDDVPVETNKAKWTHRNGVKYNGLSRQREKIRFEIPVLDVFLLSDALKCATNRHKIKDYADVMRIMKYRKLFESEAHKHSEEPPDPPKSDTTLTTKESFLEELKKQGVPLEVHKQVIKKQDLLKELEQDFSDEQIEKVIDTVNNIQEKYLVENKKLVDQNII